MSLSRGIEGSAIPAPVLEAAPASPSQPIPNAFEDGDTPAPTAQSELEKQYDVTDPSEAVVADEPPVETPAETPAVETPNDADIDSALLDRARKFEISDEEIQSLGSNISLQKYVERLEKLSKPAELAATPASPKQPEKKAETAPEFKIDLDPKEYDEKIVGTLNAMNAHYAKQLETVKSQFEAQLNQATQFAQEHQARQGEALVDAAFNDMKELKSFVGEKPLSELGAKSEQGMARIAIVEQARVLAAGYTAANKQAPELKTLLTQAAQIVLGPKLQTIATEKVREGVAQRKLQFIARGNTARGSENKTPEQRAHSAVRQLIETRGLDDE